MDRAAFIDRWRHELSGMVLDGATTQRTGADLGLFARTIMQKIDARLGAMYDQLHPETKPAAQAAPTPGGKR